MSDTAEILEQAVRWREDGSGVALATVVTTWGSSPRPVGAKLAVNDKGAMVGSVSGGCVEGAVVSEALDAIRDGKPRLLDFGVTNDQAWEVGLACGGKRGDIGVGQYAALLECGRPELEAVCKNRALGLGDGNLAEPHARSASSPLRRIWVIWATIETATSAGDTAPIDKPTGP